MVDRGQPTADAFAINQRTYRVVTEDTTPSPPYSPTPPQSVETAHSPVSQRKNTTPGQVPRRLEPIQIAAVMPPRPQSFVSTEPAIKMQGYVHVENVYAKIEKRAIREAKINKRLTEKGESPIDFAYKKGDEYEHDDDGVMIGKKHRRDDKVPGTKGQDGLGIVSLTRLLFIGIG